MVEGGGTSNGNLPKIGMREPESATSGMRDISWLSKPSVSSDEIWGVISWAYELRHQLTINNSMQEYMFAMIDD